MEELMVTWTYILTTAWDIALLVWLWMLSSRYLRLCRQVDYLLGVIHRGRVND